MIDLDSLPDAASESARTVAEAIAAGEHWSRLGGRRLRRQRDVVVFDLPGHHRLIARLDGKRCTPIEAVTHERYNRLAAKPYNRMTPRT